MYNVKQADTPNTFMIQGRDGQQYAVSMKQTPEGTTVFEGLPVDLQNLL